MNSKINGAAHCYIAYIENNPAAFFAVLHFPHPHVRNFKKGHRLVVLPDYQGLGIGHRLSSHVAQMYLNQHYRFIITSSTKALFYQRKRDPRWMITREGRVGNVGPKGELRKTSSNKLTYSYEFIGENTDNYYIINSR